MLTGRLPVRTGLTRPILAGDKLTTNPWAGETSLPKILSCAGYNTLLVGKWHIGSVPGMRPHEVGFDELRPSCMNKGLGIASACSFGTKPI